MSTSLGHQHQHHASFLSQQKILTSIHKSHFYTIWRLFERWTPCIPFSSFHASISIFHEKFEVCWPWSWKYNVSCSNSYHASVTFEKAPNFNVRIVIFRLKWPLLTYFYSYFSFKKTRIWHLHFNKEHYSKWHFLIIY